MRQEKIIIGIDPGSLRTGFAFVRLDGSGAFTQLSHGTVMLEGKKLSDRLAMLARDLSVLLDKYQPHYAVVEDVFFCKNARSALVLGQARGVALGLLGLRSIPVESLSPTQVKSMIAGRGRALKTQVAAIAAIRLGIEIPKSEDASDALALALAGGLLFAC